MGEVGEVGEAGLKEVRYGTRFDYRKLNIRPKFDKRDGAWTSGASRAKWSLFLIYELCS